MFNKNSGYIWQVYRKLLHDKFPVVYNSVELYETFYKHYKKPLK